jgi:hypothetical protein
MKDGLRGFGVLFGFGWLIGGLSLLETWDILKIVIGGLVVGFIISIGILVLFIIFSQLEEDRKVGAF